MGRSRSGPGAQQLAAVRLIREADTALGAGRDDLVGDALAVLLTEVRETPSFSALRWLTSDTDLRAALGELPPKVRDKPYASRATAELAIALEAVAPRRNSKWWRTAAWFDLVGSGFGLESLELAAVTVMLSLTVAIPVVRLYSGVPFFSEQGAPFLVGAVVAIAMAAVTVLPLNDKGEIRIPDDQESNAPLFLAATSLSFLVAALVTIAQFFLVWFGDGPRTGFGHAGGAFIEIVVGVIAACMAAPAAVYVLRAAGFVVGAPLRAVARRLCPLRGASWPVEQTWAFDPIRASRATALRHFDRHVRRWKRERAQVQAAIDADTRRVEERDAHLLQLEEALRGTATTAGRSATQTAAPYRDAGGVEIEGSPRTPTLVAAPSEEVEALWDVVQNKREGWESFRRSYVERAAHQAAASESDDVAERVVNDVASTLATAGAPLARPERRGMALFASRARGGIRRVERVAGETILTDEDVGLQTTGVRVTAEVDVDTSTKDPGVQENEGDEIEVGSHRRAVGRTSGST